MTQQSQQKREPKDMSHEELVECVQLLEEYTGTMLQMILNFHPYMGQAAQEIGKEFQSRHEAVCAKYPQSAIVVPINGILKPH